MLTLAILAILGCQKGGDAVRGGEVAFAEVMAPIRASVPVAAVHGNADASLVVATFTSSSGQSSWATTDLASWQALPGAGERLAVSTSGSVFTLDEEQGVIRYRIGAEPEQVGPDIAFLLSKRETGVYAAADGAVYVSGLRDNTAWEVYVSTDDGDSWALTPIPVDRFSGVAQHASAFSAHEGTLYSTRANGQIHTSTDGATWTARADQSTVPGVGYYGRSTVDQRGNLFRFGTEGVNVFDVRSGVDRFVAAPAEGQLSGWFAMDEEGAVYATVTVLDAAADVPLRPGTLLRDDGAGWQPWGAVPAHAGFAGTALLTTDDGVLTGAGGVLGRGVHVIDGGVEVRAGAPAEVGGAPDVIELRAHDDGWLLVLDAFAESPVPGRLLVRATEAGPELPGIELARSFVDSTGMAWAFAPDGLHTSADGGLTWTAAAPMTYASGAERRVVWDLVHVAELGGKVYAYAGGAEGYAWMSAEAGTTDFAVACDCLHLFPDLHATTVPHVGSGSVGYYYVPPIDFELVGDSPDEVWLTEDAGASWAQVGAPMPVAGSPSGVFVAFEDGALRYGSGAELDSAQVAADAEPPTLEIYGAALDTQGTAVFPPVSFDADGRLYFAAEGAVYGSEGTF